MPDAPTPDDLAAIRARHERTAGSVGPYDLGTYCRHCGQEWPCDAARLLAEVDRATVRLELARAEQGVAQDDLGTALEDLAERDEAIRGLTARLDAAEARLPTKGGGTMIVTAAELRESHREVRDLCRRAQFWAAGWRRAAYDHRDRADVALDALAALERQQARLCGRLDAAAAVVEAAREWRASLGQARRRTGLTSRYLNAVEALDTALADYDDAAREG